jgi:hypothetical protein
MGYRNRHAWRNDDSQNDHRASRRTRRLVCSELASQRRDQETREVTREAFEPRRCDHYETGGEEEEGCQKEEDGQVVHNRQEVGYDPETQTDDEAALGFSFRLSAIGSRPVA